MAKQTKREIEESLRNKLSHKHNQVIELYKKRIDFLAEENHKLSTKIKEKNDEILELKDKVEQYEDWIHRLQEFCNLPEDERIKAVNSFRTETELNDIMNNLPFIKEMYDWIFKTSM